MRPTRAIRHLVGAAVVAIAASTPGAANGEIHSVALSLRTRFSFSGDLVLTGTLPLSAQPLPLSPAVVWGTALALVAVSRAPLGRRREPAR